MQKKKFGISGRSVDYYFEASFGNLKDVVPKKTTVLITDENILSAYPNKFRGWQTIVLKAGEENKVQATVDSVIEQLLAMNADRKWTLVGVGGGVITDLAGYIASIYLRGIVSGFVPTTLLGMVDAAIGGKNGINVGIYKNMVGTIRQPQFILFDAAFLTTLPDPEWRNGFAEIIKHGAIKDPALFRELEKTSIEKYQKGKAAIQKVVQRNVLLKTRVVQADEHETGERRLLNFGHTLAHALEKQYRLMHGEAVAIGMAFAAKVSADVLKFRDSKRLMNLIDQYQLPITAGYGKKSVLEALLRDKKREGTEISFILLEKIGKAVQKKLPIEKIYQYI